MNFSFYTDLLKAENTDDGLIIEGVASTSGIDKQNEVMSSNALKSMVETNGIIPIVTSHTAEAKDVIGEVVSHQIDTEGRYVIKARLEDSDPEAVRLFNLIQKGHKMGFSVGGRILRAKPGLAKSVKRVIDAVELDHIMLTRRPVNPDTFATAMAKALSTVPEDTEETHKSEETMENEITTEATVVETSVEETVEKAGATLSAATKGALADIHAAGNDEVKAKVRALLGDDADAVIGNALATDPDPANLADGDSDDAPETGEAVNPPVAGKALSAEELDVLKSEIIATVKAELAKAVEPEPKGSATLEKATVEIGNFSKSELDDYLRDSIRKAIGG